MYTPPSPFLTGALLILYAVQTGRILLLWKNKLMSTRILMGQNAALLVACLLRLLLLVLKPTLSPASILLLGQLPSFLELVRHARSIFSFLLLL